MPNEQGVIRRLLVRACPQFLEDWLGKPGTAFRKGIHKASEFAQEHNVGEKIGHAHDLGWKALDGIASEKHAKAEADYAKAETDRMDAELRRRTLEAKTRHECADADKAEAEAGIAKIKEMQARIELFKQLKDIGVGVSIDAAMNLVIQPLQTKPPLELTDVLDEGESVVIQPHLQYVRCPRIGSFSIEAIDITRIEWLVAVGSRVQKAEQIGIMELPSSPPSAHRILALAAGIVTSALAVDVPTTISTNQVIATILPDPPSA